MFSYKGVDKDYNYKVGSVEAVNMADAIKQVKENEGIIIIVNLEKKSKNKVVNNIQSKFSEKYVAFQNKRRNSPKKQKKKSSDDIPEEKTLSDKSPILKAIKKVANKVQGENKTVVIDEDIYSELQLMFKEDSNNSKSSSTNLSENKVDTNDKSHKKTPNSGKAINWDLLNDGNSNPSLKKNMKIKVKEKEILMFTRRLHIMLSSGVSLLSALSMLRETSEKNMAKVANAVLEDIKLGSSFSEAISKFPRQFNSTYVSLISIGETSGDLAECIADIIKMKEQEQKVLKKVKNASIYPGIIAAVLGVMMTAASLFFLPRFNQMFEDQGLKTPKFTEIVFGIGDLVPYIVGGSVVSVVLIIFLRKRFRTVNKIYVGIKDKLLLKIPVVNKVTEALYMYYFSSTISLMLKNGIRLSDTLSLASRSINNIYIKSEIDNVGQLMNHGFSFSEALRQQVYFDRILVNIAMTGEESGKMVFSLSNASDYYNTELNNKVDNMMEMVPPLSIVAIAVIAAPVIVAAYLPILDISSGAALGL